MPHRKASLFAAAATATFVMAVTAAVGPITLFWTNQTRLERNVVELQIESIRNVQSLLVDAETGERGYALTDDDVFLQPYYLALLQFPAAIKTLRRVYVGDTPEEVEKTETLIAQAELKMHHLSKIVQLIGVQGKDAATLEIAAGKGKELMDAVRDMSAELIIDESAELAELDRRLIANLRWAVAISVLSFLVTLLLGRFIYVTMRSTVRRQAESATAAITASGQLSESLTRLERRNREIALLAEMARLLQTELSQKETLELASTYCRQILPASEGELFLYRNSSDALVQAANWGGATLTDSALLNPKDCWALRRGRWHLAEHAHDLRCNHYQAAPASDDTWDYCLPLVAYGEVLGLFHIRQKGIRDQAAGSLQAAEAIAEQVALALANGRMRQVLESQSIRDPLTGLYNRRFMDETLEREMARAERNGSCVSIVMLDLDNFKHLNDTFGHPSGDAVLRAVAKLLMQSLRSSDVACRLGGEELMVILPDCPLEGAASRAETIRATLEAMSITDQGVALKVTSSFGVASTVTSTSDPVALLKAADMALYAAKRAGRNRVECWPPGAGTAGANRLDGPANGAE